MNAKLQWGHACSAWISESPVYEVKYSVHASMGPRLFSVDFANSNLRPKQFPEASMGPRLFSVDFMSGTGVRAGLELASMGPRLFSVDFPLVEFTEAAFRTMLQWGHACSAWISTGVVRIKLIRNCFNGATLVQRGFHEALAQT